MSGRLINLKAIGARLQLERERLGLTRAQMADLAGVNRTTQLRYETDAHSPSLEFLAAAEAIGADSRYIITGENAEDHAKLLGYSMALVDDLMKEHELELSDDARGWLVARFMEQLELRSGKSAAKAPTTLSSVLEMLACRAGN